MCLKQWWHLFIQIGSDLIPENLNLTWSKFSLNKFVQVCKDDSRTKRLDVVQMYFDRFKLFLKLFCRQKDRVGPHKSIFLRLNLKLIHWQTSSWTVHLMLTTSNCVCHKWFGLNIFFNLLDMFALNSKFFVSGGGGDFSFQLNLLRRKILWKIWKIYNDIWPENYKATFINVQ